jgi:hypothetical protein
MILLDVKSYIKQHGQVSLEHIMHHFDLSEEMAEAIVERLERQGFIQRIHYQSEGSCSTGSCGGCNQNSPFDRFQWIGRPLKAIHLSIEKV